MIRLALLLPLAACQSTDPDPTPGDDTDLPPGFVLADQLDTARMMGHLEALDAIATASEGQRAVGSTGYARSVDHIVDALQQSGLEPRRVPFTIYLYEGKEAHLAVTAPVEGARVVEALGMRNSVPGEVEADLWPVALQIPPGPTANSSTSGCQSSDFNGFPSGAVALIQRGTCPFAEKVANADNAGASAVVVFNEGQEGRTGLFGANLTEGRLSAIPAVFITYEDGAALADLSGAQVALRVEADVVNEVDENVIVTIPGRDRDRVILVGAHLDSAPSSPGINDNGTGAALLLEIAAQAVAGDWQPETDLRLAWWGASSLGFMGSEGYFLDDAGEPDRQNLSGVEAYLHFHMLGSSNGYRFVFDGDESTTDWFFSNSGSAHIESMFDAHFASVGLTTRETLSFRDSDTIWPAVLGVPWGGLFSGSTGLKTAAEAQRVGGAERQPYDPCYQRSCDRVDGINVELYRELATGAAVVVQQLADSASPFATTSRPGADGSAPPIGGPADPRLGSSQRRALDR